MEPNKGSRKPQTRSVRESMFLIGFGVVLYCLLQNLGSVHSALHWIMDMIKPVTLGFVMAFVLNVLMASLEKLLRRIPFLKTHNRTMRSISLVLTIVLVLGLIVLMLNVLIPNLVSTLSIIAGAMPKATQTLSDYATDLMTRWNMEESMILTVQNYISNLSTMVTDFLRSSIGTVANIMLNTFVGAMNTLIEVIFGLMLAIYVLADKERIARFMVRVMEHFLPVRFARNLSHVAAMSFRTFSDFVRSQVIESVILGVLYFVLILPFNIPYTTASALIIGVTHILPVFGAWIGGIAAAILIVAVDPSRLLFFIIFYVILQQVESNAIYPHVVGSSIGLPGVLVLASVIVGQRVAGTVGILLAVPLCAVLYTILREVMGVNKSPESASAEKKPSRIREFLARHSSSARKEESPESTEADTDEGIPEPEGKAESGEENP